MSVGTIWKHKTNAGRVVYDRKKHPFGWPVIRRAVGKIENSNLDIWPEWFQDFREADRAFSSITAEVEAYTEVLLKLWGFLNRFYAYEVPYSSDYVYDTYRPAVRQIHQIILQMPDQLLGEANRDLLRMFGG